MSKQSGTTGMPFVQVVDIDCPMSAHQAAGTPHDQRVKPHHLTGEPEKGNKRKAKPTQRLRRRTCTSAADYHLAYCVVSAELGSGRDEGRGR